jgi:voltage-gated potassium channel
MNGLDKDQNVSHRFDRISVAVIFISVVLFTIETMPEFSGFETYFKWIDTFIVLFFTAEYLVRYRNSHYSKKFVFSFFGMIDLLSILPFWLSFGFADVRWLRILRLLRIFRVLKFVRYIKAADRLKHAILNIKEELIVFTFLSLLVVYISSVGIYYCEREAQPQHFTSILHSMWWSIVTLTTVGYGDVYPVTPMGRVFTGIILFAGVSLISIPSGLLASSFTKILKDEHKE